MVYSQIIALLLSLLIINNSVMVNSQLQEGEICNTDSGKKGRCLLIENCPAALALVLNGEKPKVCSFQGKNPIVCCEDVVSSRVSISTRKCLAYSKLKYPIAYIPSLIAGVGGSDANRLEFPHMAVLGYGSIFDPKWLCGGSLLSENFVLTAAHCIYSQHGNISVIKLGMHQLTETNVYVQNLQVKNSYLHPEYNPLQSYHDIALIELNKPAFLNAGVKPACLHTSKQLPSTSFTGTGWGATKLYGDNSDILQKVNLSYVSHNNCASFYKGQKKLPKGLIDDWQICADGGGARADTCQGDSGGPLQLPRDENETDSLYTIIGITSVGIKCALVPAIYTRISYYVPWIESIVWPN